MEGNIWFVNNETRPGMKGDLFLKDKDAHILSMKTREGRLNLILEIQYGTCLVQEQHVIPG
jgi:hypothetical protein